MKYFKTCLIFLILPVFLLSHSLNVYAANAVYPKGSISVSFNGKKTYANTNGSDNWAITWASDDNQYTAWGDGGGFAGGYFYNGVARVTGATVGALSGTNIYTGNGKSYGLLEVDNTLYMWVCGTTSNNSAYTQQVLWKSTNYKSGTSASFTQAGVSFTQSNGGNFFCPTFLQFGKGYAGAKDTYIYIYAPKIDNNTWDVQPNGEIFLMRVPKDQITNKSSYQYYSGTVGGSSTPSWTSDISAKKAVFKDATNGVMRTSVIYNAGLGKYILTTQQVKRTLPGAYIGIYDAPNPWGPWTTILFADAGSAGLNSGDPKTVFWNFSNKWTSSDGKSSVIVYTGDDILATANAVFTTGSTTPTPTGISTNTPTPTSSKPGDANNDGKVDGLDYVIWLNNYNKTVSGGASQGDFDGSGKVDGLDYVIWLTNYGK